MWLLLALLTAGFILDLGMWKESESFRGPFQLESSNFRSYVVELGRSNLARTILDTGGKTRGPTCACGSMEKLGAWLYFALPNGVTNSGNLEATATYTVKIRARVLIALASAAAMLIWLRIFLAYCAGELVGFVYR